MWRKEDVIKALRKRQGKKTVREYAAELTCSAGYLNDVLNDRRDPGPQILDHLGLECRIEKVYVEKKRWR